ncbi:MAG: CaiB/BaiF CoA transferase family protein [Myxococcota bacterium]
MDPKPTSTAPDSPHAAALAGRRVLELAGASGHYCGKLFADMGADVLKIERPGGDASRALRPWIGRDPGPDRSLVFAYMNTSKRGVTLDLAQPEGRELFRKLASGADLVLETTPPGTLEALDLGFETLRRDHPALVMTSITGFGQTGPHRGYRSSDLVAGALGGAMHVTGSAADPPVRLAGTQAYASASICAAASSMIALFHARRSGQGQHVDISLEETMVSVSHICGIGKWLDDRIVPRRSGPGLFASVPSGTYRCRDGLIYLMVNRPAHWQALASWVHEVTGNREILDPMFEGPSSNRYEYRELLDLFIGELTATQTVESVYREGQRRRIAFTPVQTLEGVNADRQLASRGYFVVVEHPEHGPLRLPGAPYQHSETPCRISRPAPRVGEHNREIYGGELGLADAELEALAANGVL